MAGTSIVHRSVLAVSAEPFVDFVAAVAVAGVTVAGAWCTVADGFDLAVQAAADGTGSAVAGAAAFAFAVAAASVSTADPARF